MNIDQWNKMLGSYLMPTKSLLRVYIYGIINTYSASAICMENTQYVRDWILSTYIHSHFDEEIIQSKDISVIRSYKIDILIHRPSVRRKLCADIHLFGAGKLERLGLNQQYCHTFWFGTVLIFFHSYIHCTSKVPL